MRLDYQSHREITDAMRMLSHAADDIPLDARLVELIKIRASQINGCAFCLEIHTRNARREGETDLRIDLVAAWRESPVYSDRERAALRWCEELTLLSESEVADDLYEEISSLFSDDEIAALTLAIVSINSWNRVAVAFRAPIGTR